MCRPSQWWSPPPRWCWGCVFVIGFSINCTCGVYETILFAFCVFLSWSIWASHFQAHFSLSSSLRLFDWAMCLSPAALYLGNRCSSCAILVQHVVHPVAGLLSITCVQFCWVHFLSHIIICTKSQLIYSSSFSQLNVLCVYKLSVSGGKGCQARCLCNKLTTNNWTMLNFIDNKTSCPLLQICPTTFFPQPYLGGSSSVQHLCLVTRQH